MKLIEDFLRPEQIYRSFLRFYSSLLPYRDQVVVANFPRVTRNFADVIAAVNAKYDCAFRKFANDASAVQQCFDHIDRCWAREDRKYNGTKGRSPSTNRKSLQQEYRPLIEAPRLAGLRSDAQSLYRCFVGC